MVTWRASRATPRPLWRNFCKQIATVATTGSTDRVDARRHSLERPAGRTRESSSSCSLISLRRRGTEGSPSWSQQSPARPCAGRTTSSRLSVRSMAFHPIVALDRGRKTIAPWLKDLFDWMIAEWAKLSGHNDVAKPIDSCSRASMHSPGSSMPAESALRLIWVYGIGDDGAMAFSDLGVENPNELI